MAEAPLQGDTEKLPGDTKKPSSDTKKLQIDTMTYKDVLKAETKPVFDEDHSNKGLVRDILKMKVGFSMYEQPLHHSIRDAVAALSGALLTLTYLGLTKDNPPLPLEEAIQVLRCAYDEGIYLWSGGMHYGTQAHNSLNVLVEYFSRFPEHTRKVVINLKGCWDTGANKPRCNYQDIMKCAEEIRSLTKRKKLNIIFTPTRLDPDDCFPGILRTLGRLVERGYFIGIGLCEVGPETLWEARKCCRHLCLVETELSPITIYSLSNRLVALCRKLDLPLLGTAPFARGLLTNAFSFHTSDTHPPQDSRSRFPRFQKRRQSFAKSLEIARWFQTQAGLPSGPDEIWLALQWAVSNSIIPVPSSTSVEHVRGIAASARHTVSPETDNAFVAFLSPEAMKRIAMLPERCNENDKRYIDVPWDIKERKPRRSPRALKKDPKKDPIRRVKEEFIDDVLSVLKERIKKLPNGPDDKYNNQECTGTCIFCRRKSCQLMG